MAARLETFRYRQLFEAVAFGRAQHLVEQRLDVRRSVVDAMRIPPVKSGETTTSAPALRIFCTLRSSWQARDDAKLGIELFGGRAIGDCGCRRPLRQIHQPRRQCRRRAEDHRHFHRPADKADQENCSR